MKTKTNIPTTATDPMKRDSTTSTTKSISPLFSPFQRSQVYKVCKVCKVCKVYKVGKATKRRPELEGLLPFRQVPLPLVN